MKCCVPLLLAGGLLLAADSPEGAIDTEKSKLVGTWNVVSVEANGQKVPAEAIKTFQFIFTVNSLTPVLCANG